MNDPQNPDPTPDVLHADWSVEQVERLFSDLQAGAKVHHVQVRTSAPQSANDRATTLADAKSLWLSGEAKAIQIRYDYGGESWCDTLMVLPDTIRVVRTILPESD